MTATVAADTADLVLLAEFAGTLPMMEVPHADDDAQAARWLPVVDLLAPGTLAFDHTEILSAAVTLDGHRREG